MPSPEAAERAPEAAAEPEKPAVPAKPSGRRSREAPIPLEAALPAVIYEEFTAAVARAEEARDEIPSHPDDVETPEERGEAQAAPAQEGAGTPAGEDGELAEPASASSETSGDDGEHEHEHEHWERHKRAHSEGGGVISVPEAPTAAPVEVIGSEDALEELPQRHKRRWRHYKIQEVIKRNQIVLIQVVKEERGTKGAALTSYLSLAGRYTVLMPNTPSGGGISRKITVPADRKRLKEIAQELEVPEGMGLIIRTAGASRTKAEIKRDFEYLLRLWENVRDLTLKSTAPCLVYEEGNLIKRSIRDLYNKDIDEILVAGDDAHREAKDFMRMLMPSHAKNVIQYREPEPLFTKYEVERQLNQMFSPVVTLKSGGYIVLNQTEALVAIDVNSGRATREYSIEDTALKTNLEASDEVARQVRLRDLAGLIVIDYIDMDERRNNRAVERRLKEALRHDRARIQVGHISHFGLLEMSRQRLRQGVVEVSTMPCPICQGVGHIRSTEFGCPHGPALDRGPSAHARRGGPYGGRIDRGRALYPQSQARLSPRHRDALWRIHRHPDGRKRPWWHLHADTGLFRERARGCRVRRRSIWSRLRKRPPATAKMKKKRQRQRKRKPATTSVRCAASAGAAVVGAARLRASRWRSRMAPCPPPRAHLPMTAVRRRTKRRRTRPLPVPPPLKARISRAPPKRAHRGMAAMAKISGAIAAGAGAAAGVTATRWAVAWN